MCESFNSSTAALTSHSNQSLDHDLSELQELQGINVWGHHQETLEQQALKEFEIFKATGDQKEDGELSGDEKIDDKTVTAREGVSLDISSYIKRQEELKKRQVHIKSLSVSEKSKKAAEEISLRQKVETKRKKSREKRNVKRAKIENDVNINNNISDIKLSNDNQQSVVHDGNDSGSEYIPSDPDSDYEPGFSGTSDTVQVPKRKIKKSSNIKIERVTDDGLLKCYKLRLEKYYKQLEEENNFKEGSLGDEEVEIKSGFKITAKIWNNLYSYQQEGVEWLWELYKKSTGGLLGDEMGLGKTVEIIAFLYGVHYSRPVSSHGRYTGLGPTIIVCPSTVIHQWVKHFHDWAPEFRVAVLHQSGSFTGNRNALIKEINKTKGILITTYQGILKHKGYLLELDWHYIILDEGHKIRNHGAQISVVVKEFRTPYRIMLTGSPMQNNLQELWSLFDFVNPGMLGTLPVFLEHFAVPIMQGGYSNATPMQESLALSMATALKNMITPFLLRRTKQDVKQAICLPNKSEQVLFCSLTREQRDLYKGYLMCEQVGGILGRGSKNWFSENHTRANVLMAITTLRKICNHPDLYLNDTDCLDEDEDNKTEEEKFGYYKRCGKMIVVSALLKIWKKQNHRVLLFTQSRGVIKIFGIFLQQEGYKYLKMDGSTAVTSRQTLIDKFNQDSSYDVFLLTTRVGGLGVNLTGANRVIIFDPDWNPATDTQARERAWRIGQEKEVTIYRLLSAGTIEEKMYQRQVWKQLLSNKVLLDPKTQKFFKTSDLHDLFSLQEEVENPETANIFKNSRISLEEKIKKKDKKKSEVTFTKDKLDKMRQMAAEISKNISQTSEQKELNKTIDQKELEEERRKKLEERKLLKQMTPIELRQYNREKLKTVEEGPNKLDDCDTEVSFTKALVISEKTAELYNEAKIDKNKIDKATKEYESLTKIFHKKDSKRKEKVVVDQSGKLEGEKIDGLIKREVKKSKSKMHSAPSTESMDSYVLEKLFTKKGVQTVLQHDTIVQCKKTETNSIKLHSETKNRTDLALAALRKSRFSKWRW